MRWLTIFAFMLPAASAAADCTVRSGSEAHALVELYTSEGCSSCPPADRWLSSFTSADPRVVPIAFHVGYWDYIGWKDKFADERYTQRQRDLAKIFASQSVYTPQVVLAGRDYRSWRDSRATAAAIDQVKRQSSGAQIEITLRADPGSGLEGNAAAQLSPGAAHGDLDLFVAVTQNGLSNRVTAGENRGEKLEHNFVARDLAVIRDLKGTFRFRPKADWDLERMSVVAFVQDRKTGRVLQALAAPICR
jgi:hypothetical protein